MKDEGLASLLNLINDFPQHELQSPNMRPIRADQFGQLKQSDEIINDRIFTYGMDKQEFGIQKFILLPNLLIMMSENPKHINHLMVPTQQYQTNVQLQDNAQYLILSNCTISKKILQYKDRQAFGMILSNSIGNTYLFFPQFITHRNWYKQLKQFCKLTGFLEKYKLGEKILPGFYTCIKKKSKTQNTVQIYKLDDFDQCQELEEAVHNEIHILRSIRHQSLLELKRVYENPKYLFIVYEYYQGESLFKMFNSGLQLHEVQVASIVYQTLQLVKFLNQHQFYHGSINSQNILINTQNQMLQITVINLSFKEYKVNDKLDWLLNRAVESFLAPEIYEGIAPSVSSDLYAIGCMLYFMSFYDASKYQLQNDDKDFYYVMDNFEIDINHLLQKEKELSSQYGQNSGNPALVSASQIDLLKKLIEIDPSKRMTMKESTKHHWFVNVKNKIKSMKHERKRKKPLPSLRTIIELREQSEMDIRMTIIQQQQSGLNVIGSRFNGTQQYSSTQQIRLPQIRKSMIPQQTNLKYQFDDEMDVPEDTELNLVVRCFRTDIWSTNKKKQQK